MCQKCNQNTCNGCTQEFHICNICPQEEPCDCPILGLSTDCSTYTGDDIKCGEVVVVPKNTILSNALQLIVSWTCTRLSQVQDRFKIVNTGVGASMYSGDTLLGEKKLRKLKSSNSSVVIVEGTDDIDLTVIGQETKVTAGTNVTVTGNGTIATPYVINATDTYTGNNVGVGTSIYKDTTEPTANNFSHNFKKINSNSLVISEDVDGTIQINNPSANTIPELYVNNFYVPTYEEWLINGGGANPLYLEKGKGTMAKPFTDSIKYTSPILYVITANTAIQNALDAYVNDPTNLASTGTRLNPDLSGQRIKVQDNNSFYTFAGDFSYSNLDIILEKSVVCTNTGYLVDMDNATYFDTENASVKIEIKDKMLLELVDSLGFRNSGNTSTTPPSYTSGRIIQLLGEGTVFTGYSGANILTRYLLNSDGNNNDDGLHFNVECKLRADQQGVYFAKNKTRIDFYNLIQSGTYQGSGHIGLKAFHMTGGQVRFYEKGAISLGNETTGRTYGITFEPTGVGIGYCNFQLNSAKVYGTSQRCFVRLNNENVGFLAFNSPSGEGFSTTLIGTPTIVNGLFENLGVSRWNVDMKNCVFSYTGIDHTKVDLTSENTMSAINFIGGSVIETLIVKNNRLNAIAVGIPLYSAFLNRGNLGVAEGSETNTYPDTTEWYRDIVLPA